MARIKKGDTVKIMSGALAGTEAKVKKVLPKDGTALLAGIGLRKRHVRPSQLNPYGSTREIHVPINVSKLVKVAEEKTVKVPAKKKEKK